jgi:hypothetical protein
MKEVWDYQKCVLILTGEILLLKQISAAQDTLRHAVINREWADFDGKNQEIDRLAGEFARCEEDRVSLFSALTDESPSESDVPAKNEENSFYAAIMALPTEERRVLSRLYRELKMETLKMRTMNETFLAYLTEAKSLAVSYLEAVCPAGGGKLYTHRGRRVAQDLRSIVINNRF